MPEDRAASPRRAVIITALPVEYAAVRTHLTDLRDEEHPQGDIYERGVFKTEDGAWHVGIVEIGAGNSGAAQRTERAITHFRPQVVLFVGVAGGIKDVAIGDVVAATKVYGYHSGKAEAEFRTRPEVGLPTHRLLERARSEKRKGDWIKRLAEPPKRMPQVLLGPIAAGEQVVASIESETYRLIRAGYGDALAVEMEGYGFLKATHAYSGLESLVVRGISDLIEGKTEADQSGSQELASRHAAAFAFEVLAKLNFPSPAHSTLFDNQGIIDKGNLPQTGGNIYTGSAHVQGSGTAVVFNGVPVTAQTSESPLQSEAGEPLCLVLAFDPTKDGALIRWESDPLGVRTSTFAHPYQGDDLALVARALDALQHPNYPYPRDVGQRRRFSFDAGEQARLAAVGLWDDAGQLRADSHRRVGRALYEALTADSQAREALAIVRNHASATGRSLAVALCFPRDAVALAALPWELLWDDEPPPLLFSRGAVASCVRHLDLAEALPPNRPRRGPLRILAIFPHTGIDAGVREAERAAWLAVWQPLVDQGRVQINEVSPATRTAVVDAVQRHQPNIIHYYGHGFYREKAGALLFDAPDGKSSWIDVDRLVTLFGGARLVVLHACQGAKVGEEGDAGLLTGIAPALSAAGVPLVIGMQITVRTEAATRAGAVMYGALAAGRSAQEAVGRARQALYVEEDDQCSWYVPVLYIRSREVGLVYL